VPGARCDTPAPGISSTGSSVSSAAPRPISSAPGRDRAAPAGAAGRAVRRAPCAALRRCRCRAASQRRSPHRVAIGENSVMSGLRSGLLAVPRLSYSTASHAASKDRRHDGRGAKHDVTGRIGPVAHDRLPRRDPRAGWARRADSRAPSSDTVAGTVSACARNCTSQSTVSGARRPDRDGRRRSPTRRAPPPARP